MTRLEAETIVEKELGADEGDAEFGHMGYEEGCARCSVRLAGGQPAFRLRGMGAICADRVGCQKRRVEAAKREEKRFRDDLAAGEIRLAE